MENDFHTAGREEDSVFLQWRLMQTDAFAARTGCPKAIVRVLRALIRLREQPRTLLHRRLF